MFELKEIDGIRYEDFSHGFHSPRGKCKKSCFSIGYHRIGLVPTVSILDGGMSGDIAREICVECGKWLNGTVFIPKKQPSRIVKELTA